MRLTREVDCRSQGELAPAGPVDLDDALSLKRPQHAAHVRLAIGRLEDREPLDVGDRDLSAASVLLEHRDPERAEVRLGLEEDVDAGSLSENR